MYKPNYKVCRCYVNLQSSWWKWRDWSCILWRSLREIESTVDSRALVGYIMSIHSCVLCLSTEGFKEAAEKFRMESGIEPSVDLDSLDERIKIREMILKGQIQEAIALINSLHPELLDTNRYLYFHLQVRMFPTGYKKNTCTCLFPINIILVLYPCFLFTFSLILTFVLPNSYSLFICLPHKHITLPPFCVHHLHIFCSLTL